MQQYLASVGIAKAISQQPDYSETINVNAVVRDLACGQIIPYSIFLFSIHNTAIFNSRTSQHCSFTTFSLHKASCPYNKHCHHNCIYFTF